MAWSTTTPEALRASFITKIRGITPSYIPKSSHLWKYSERIAEVKGTSPRLFRLDDDLETHEQDPDGPWGDGLGYRYDLHVVTSYGGFKTNEVEFAIGQDGRQLFLNLLDLIIPDVSGLYDVRYIGWETESEEPPVWGRHVLMIRYFASDAR